MIHKKLGDIEWLEFELLADHPKAVHGVFLRHGGVSHYPFCSSLNISKPCGDHLENIYENCKRLCATLNLKQWVSCRQIHGDQVKWVLETKNNEFCGYDGMMTAHHDLGLLIAHADCQAAIFYDPIHHVCAAVHAGWRGQVKNIYKQTVQKMREAFHTKPEDLFVCISPSLGPENSEFKNYEVEFPLEFQNFQIKPTYFNLWEIARYQLEACGLLPHHIQIAEINTYAHPKDFFSYRRERAGGGQVTGAHGTLIALVP